MRICPRCKVEQEEESFLSKQKHIWHVVCFPCRRRDLNRIRMAKKRALETYMGGIRERVVRRDAQVAAPRLRALKARFLQVTAGTRARIKAMENNVNPKARTERALAARRAIMVRYEAAYAEQGRMVASGVVPEDIMGYM